MVALFVDLLTGSIPRPQIPKKMATVRESTQTNFGRATPCDKLLRQNV